jgi:predicted MFS family arabinose efflux permease
VAHDEIGSGLALNSTQFNLSRILGPSVAGLIMARSGALACFVVSAISYIPFIGVALWILPPRALPAQSRPNPLSIFSNVGTILRVRVVRRSLLTVLVTTVFCSPLLVFSPVLVRDVFHGTAAQFSTAIAMFGVGGLAGAAALLAIGPGVDRERLASIFAIVYGVAVVLAAVNPVWWVLPVLLVVAGIAMTMSNTSANTVLQLMADPSSLGQTVSLYLLALSSGNSIGSVLTGAAVSVFGVRPALLVNGLAAIVAQAAIARFDRPAARPSA